MSATGGSLALARAALFVGTQAKTACVRGFDLGGRELGLAFTFRDPLCGRSAVAGIAVDEDHSLWIADLPADRVRRFSVFGRETGGIAPADPARPAILPGSPRRPTDVEIQDGLVVVASADESPHAVQLFDPEAIYRSRCFSLGDPGRSFGRVTRVAVGGARLYVAESLTRRTQVFRGTEFHFAFELSDALGRRLEPCAVAALEDRRSVVACRAPESALVLVDESGRSLRVLAREGGDEGGVIEPSDVVVEAGQPDHCARLFVLDRDGTRLQVYTLEGRCLGSIPLESGLRSAPGQGTVPRGKRGGR